MIQVETTPYGADAHRAPAEIARPGGDPLRPVSVVVSSNPIGIAARRALGHAGGIAAVTFLLRTGSPNSSGPRPSPPPDGGLSPPRYSPAQCERCRLTSRTSAGSPPTRPPNARSSHTDSVRGGSRWTRAPRCYITLTADVVRTGRSASGCGPGSATSRISSVPPSMPSRTHLLCSPISAPRSSSLSASRRGRPIYSRPSPTTTAFGDCGDHRLGDSRSAVQRSVESIM